MAQVPFIRYGELVERRALRHAASVALRYEGTTVTFAELRNAILAVAEQLGALGVAPGERVVFVGGNRPELLTTLYATTRIGAVFVPANGAAPAAELALILRDTTPAVVVAEARCRVMVAAACADTGIDTTLVCCDDDPEPGWLALSLPVPPPQVAPQVPVRPDDPAVIVYTSGTTGSPKGVVLSHGALFWNNVNTLFDLDVASDDVVLTVSPLFHIGALNGVGVLTLAKGGTIVLERRFDAGRVLGLIAEERVTSMFAVPTMLALLSRQPGFAAADLSSLRWVNCGGAPVPDSVVRLWQQRGVAVLPSFGLSEAGPSVSFTRPGDPVREPGATGTPGLFTDVSILTPAGEPVAPGEVGQVVVAGPHVASGYWNRPEATAATFRDDGLRTGDRGRIDATGALVITGREKELIITGGENVDPGEVESALVGCPGIRDVAVVGMPDPVWGEVVTAIVVPDASGPPDLEVLQRVVGATLARYKLPRRIEIWDALPRNTVGKLVRAEVRRMAADRTPAPG